MKIHYTIIVPPHVGGDPDRLVAYVSACVPAAVAPADIALRAQHAVGLTVEFDQQYATLDDAKLALAGFFARTGKIPEPASAPPDPLLRQDHTPTDGGT